MHEELSMVMGLVEECSSTLESLDIADCLAGRHIQLTSAHISMTSVSSQVDAAFDRSLESDKTQRCGL